MHATKASCDSETVFQNLQCLRSPKEIILAETINLKVLPPEGSGITDLRRSGDRNRRRTGSGGDSGLFYPNGDDARPSSRSPVGQTLSHSWNRARLRSSVPRADAVPQDRSDQWSHGRKRRRISRRGRPRRRICRTALRSS